jgi:hypothetical protein
LTKDKKGYIVVGMGSFTGKDLVIPPYHKDLPVVKVGDNAFTKIPLRNIYISENIVEIGSEAFYKCNAYHVTFAPNSSLRKLGYRALAFNGTNDLWDLPDKLILPYLTLKLPEPLEEIGEQAVSYTKWKQNVNQLYTILNARWDLTVEDLKESCQLTDAQMAELFPELYS